MDDGLDYDDLFGDEPTIAISSPPIAPSLSQRVDELRTSGCCQRIAWSKLGCVAHITTDGQGFGVRSLLCNSETGKWSLSDDYPVPRAQMAHEGHQIVHLSWHHSGSELAVIDALGGISIYTMVIAMNRLTASRLPIADQEDDLSGVVGMAWMNLERPFAMARPAGKSDGQYHYNWSSHKPTGPFHPLDGSLLLVVRTTSLQYRLYRINVDWKLSSQQPTSQSQLPFAPLLTIHPIKTLSSSDIAESTVNSTTAGINDQIQVTHVELLPPLPPVKGVKPSLPNLLILAAIVPPIDQSHQSAQTIFVRYEIGSSPAVLVPSFDQLGSKKNPQSLDLKRLEDIRAESIAISIHQISASDIFAVAYSDGTIEYRHRQGMSVVAVEEQADRIFSLSQVGFAFPADEACLYVALSPCACLAVKLNGEGEVKLAVMKHHSGGVENTQHGHLGLQFINETYRALGLSVDHSIELHRDQLYRNINLQRCLSMQDSLGFSGQGSQRSLAAKVAWLTLDLRLVALKFAYTFNQSGSKSNGQSQNDFTKADVFQMLYPLVKWSFDLMNFLVDELLELANLLKDHYQDKQFLQKTLLKHNTCSLPILFCSIPRNYMRQSCRGLRGLGASSQKSIEYAHEEEQLYAFNSILDIVTASPVKVTQFEQLLVDLESSIKAAYQDRELGEADRAVIEKEMLTSTEIPEILMPVVEKALTSMLTKLRAEMDPSALHFADHSWLGLGDDARSVAYRKSGMVDVMRKVPLKKGAKLRRCTRCCSFSEDILPQASSIPWIANLHKNCVCASVWILVSPPK
ncbi:MAG: hypothetical protein M1825_003565 [Sarcosagium campestre]|nr:MAG: hypothetical protein M1825_003565 [Sarcosagium campestre]